MAWILRLVHALCVLVVAAGTAPPPAALSTEAHFFTSIFGSPVLDSMPVQPRAVASAPNSTLRRDGFAWWPMDHELATLLKWPAAPTGQCSANGEDCLQLPRNEREVIAQHVTDRLVEVMQRSESAAVVSCAPHPLTVFSRSGIKPQNMHYDSVASDVLPCNEVIYADRELPMSVRAWMPFGSPVESAPLLIVNTSALHVDACGRRTYMGGGSQSSTAKILSAADLAADCAAGAASASCNWFHTLGMQVGSILFFRNGEVHRNSTTDRN